MKDWSLSKKIWSIIGLLAFAFIGSTLYSLKNLSDVRDSLNELTGTIVKRDQLTASIKDTQRKITILTAESIIFTKPEQLKANEIEFQSSLVKMEKDIEEYQKIASEKGKAILVKYLQEHPKYITALKQTREYSLVNRNDEASAVFVNAREKIAPPMLGYLQDLNDLTGQILDEKSATANADASRAIFFGFAIAFISITIAVLISFFVLRAITQAIGSVVRNLSDSSVQVSSAASQIASSAEELSQSTTEQAASLEETAASVEEMNSMIAKNSENATSAANTSTKSQEAVSQGQEVIKKMNEAMEKINRSSEGMAEIVKVIEQIDKKTKVINEIVNKTELLSFNASVEAARAGEHGKGFAVVAEEVGNLARMSGSAAEEISSLLEESISKVNQLVLDTKGSVETGAQVAGQCGQVFQEIVQNVSSVSGMATEIASASQEQSRGVSEITKAMSQLDQMTQQNAATSEECASSAEELSAQAEALKKAVSLLVTTVNGKGEQAPANETPHFEKKTFKKTAAANPAGQAGKSASNVIHLKSPKTSSGSPAPGPVYKKVSGEAPSFDHSGFEDV